MKKMSFENFTQFVELVYGGSRSQLLYRKELAKVYEMIQEKGYDIYLVKNEPNNFTFAYKNEGDELVSCTMHIKPDQMTVLNGHGEDGSIQEKVQITTLPNGMIERKYGYTRRLDHEEFLEAYPAYDEDPTITGETQISYLVEAHELYNKFGVIVYQKARNSVMNEDNSEPISDNEITSVIDLDEINAPTQNSTNSTIKVHNYVTDQTKYYARDNRESITRPVQKLDSTEPGVYSTIDITENMLILSKEEKDADTAELIEKQIKRAVNIVNESTSQA